MRSSRFYQNCLQLVSRLGEITMFISALFLGKEEYKIAIIILVLRILIGMSTSELVYRRLKATIKEK